MVVTGEMICTKYKIWVSTLGYLVDELPITYIVQVGALTYINSWCGKGSLYDLHCGGAGNDRDGPVGLMGDFKKIRREIEKTTSMVQTSDHWHGSTIQDNNNGP